MSFQKSQTNFKLLLSFALLGLIYSQITVPLKINDQQLLYFPAKFGLSQCDVDIFISMINCSRFLIETTPETVKCGPIYKGGINVTPFQLGDEYAKLQYSDSASINTFCVGFNDIHKETNSLEDLYEQKLIQQRIIYFSLNETLSQNSTIGEANIGSPNQSLIKKDAKLVQLKYSSFYDKSYLIQNRGLKFFGKQLDFKNVHFNFDKDHKFTRKAFLQMVSIFDQNGIKHVFDRNEETQIYRVQFPSIEKLQPIELSLLLEDNTIYPLTLQVSQYTRKLDNGKYQLAIQALFDRDYIELSYNVFKSHYVGFDQYNGIVFVAEKAQQKISNFRGSSNIFN